MRHINTLHQLDRTKPLESIKSSQVTIARDFNKVKSTVLIQQKKYRTCNPFPLHPPPQNSIPFL